jgi:hypothetical protein
LYLKKTQDIGGSKNPLFENCVSKYSLYQLDLSSFKEVEIESTYLVYSGNSICYFVDHVQRETLLLIYIEKEMGKLKI